MILELEDFQNYTETYNDESKVQLQQVYLESAQNIVEDYLGYELTEKNYKILIDGNGTDTISLKSKPVKTINSITIDGVEYSEDKENLSYLIDGQYLTLFGMDKTFTKGERNVLVDYDSGYKEDNLPSIIKLTIFRIGALLQSEANSNIGVTSKTFGDEGTRTFVQTRKYADYLIQVSKYKLI